MIARNWSRVEETTPGNAGAPLDSGTRSLDRVVRGERRQLTTSAPAPQTICHVRVTVRHRSPRPGSDRHDVITGSVQLDAGTDALPVPALRRAGNASKRTPPPGRHVTFSELPLLVVDERRPMFAAQRPQHSETQPALDTLWHYHEIYPSLDKALQAAATRGNTTLDQTYPSVDSRAKDSTLGRDGLDLPDRQVSSPADDRSQETTRNENDNENTKSPDDVRASPCSGKTTAPEQSSLSAGHHDPSSISLHDDDECDDTEAEEKRHHQQQQQQQGEGTSNAADDLEEISLSLRQLVASFESMTSPYMRPPVIAASRTQ